MAALRRVTAAENPVPDTGDLERDLRTLMGQLLEFLRGEELQRLVRTAAALGPADDAAPASMSFWRARLRGATTIVDRAVSRGELPASTDGDAVIEFLVAPAYLRLLLTACRSTTSCSTPACGARSQHSAQRAPKRRPRADARLGDVHVPDRLAGTVCAADDLVAAVALDRVHRAVGVDRFDDADVLVEHDQVAGLRSHVRAVLHGAAGALRQA